MKQLLLGCGALAIVAAIACSENGGPTQPTITPAAPPTSVAPSPAATPTPSGDVTTSRNAKDSYTWKIVRNDGEKVVVEATNITDENHDVWLTCYEGLATDPANQTLFDTQRHSLGAGSSATFTCSVPCGPGQVDLHEGPPPEPPVGWARNLIVGRPTQGSGDRCNPPPTGCELDLRCIEERSQETIVEIGGLSKHLVCNVPGSWQHDADEYETTTNRFWGYWSPVATPETGNVKFTAAASPQCMQTFAWPIPVDKCIDARLNIDIDTESTDTHTTVIVKVDSDSAGFIDFTQGQQNNRANFGPGVSTTVMTYPRDKVDRTVFIAVVNDCLQRNGRATIPRLPPPPPQCVPPNVQNFELDGPIGDPVAECSHFGNFVPGTPADFFVTKCGLFYEVTHDAWNSETCSNGKDVSHSTACKCGPIVD